MANVFHPSVIQQKMNPRAVFDPSPFNRRSQTSVDNSLPVRFTARFTARYVLHNAYAYLTQMQMDRRSIGPYIEAVSTC